MPQVTIAWTAVPGATSYNIYWSTTTGVAPANGTRIAGVTTASYTHAPLNNGTTYYYVVTAVFATGESAAIETGKRKTISERQRRQSR